MQREQPASRLAGGLHACQAIECPANAAATRENDHE